MTIVARVEKLTKPFGKLSIRTKCLLSLWGFFFVLVACGIHGSSTGVTADWWAPEKPYKGYLFNPPRLGNLDAGGMQELTMAKARWIRWDELLIATPLALGQLSHRPKFPVVNTNIANGQNMLTWPHVPVWHIVTLARPATWGYFILGAQRGLAWYWWFRVFSCFTVLYLLLEIILKGHRRLAAFGAFWFCSSAYVVCWSLWPAQVVFFPALGCLAAYHLLASNKKSIQFICASLLGLSVPGFVMYLYPPWQVTVGYLLLFVFAGLFVRDKLYRSFESAFKQRLLCLAGAVLLAGGLTLSFLAACLPDLKVMSHTVYPGQRVSLGGDYSVALLFKGIYNLITIYATPAKLSNQSEAASFYYFFPAVFLGICLSKRLASKLGILGWLMVSYLVVMLIFLLAGVPKIVARLTFLSYVPPYRADIGIGLASILLCVSVLALTADLNKGDEGRWHKSIPRIVCIAVVLFFIYHGLALMKAAEGFPPVSEVLFASLLAGLLSYLLLAGKSAFFCGSLSAILVATTAIFNPLSTNLDHLYGSELAEQIVRINSQTSGRPLWLCYGGVQPGMLITILGGRSLTGIHWPPQLSVWRALDQSGGGYESIYNRYAQVSLAYRDDDKWVSFNDPASDALVVRVSPTHPVLRAMGARFVLAMGDEQSELQSSGLSLLYKSSNGGFSIFELPDLEKPSQGENSARSASEMPEAATQD